MQSYLTKLTAFNNRYYSSTTGQQASQYIYDTVTSVSYTPASSVPSNLITPPTIQLAASRSDITVTKFAHSWSQFSVIARIEGKSSGAITVIGAHEDSINLSSAFAT